MFDFLYDEGFLITSDEEDEEFRRRLEERNFVNPDDGPPYHESFDEEEIDEI